MNLKQASDREQTEAREALHRRYETDMRQIAAAHQRRLARIDRFTVTLKWLVIIAAALTFPLPPAMSVWKIVKTLFGI